MPEALDPSPNWRDAGLADQHPQRGVTEKKA